MGFFRICPKIQLTTWSQMQFCFSDFKPCLLMLRDDAKLLSAMVAELNPVTPSDKFPTYLVIISVDSHCCVF